MQHSEAWGVRKKLTRGESTVSIQKKSLINNLKSAKKANVVKEEVTTSAATASPVKVLARQGHVSTRQGHVSTRQGHVSTRKGHASTRKSSVTPRIVV